MRLLIVAQSIHPIRTQVTCIRKPCLAIVLIALLMCAVPLHSAGASEADTTWSVAQKVGSKALEQAAGDVLDAVADAGGAMLPIDILHKTLLLLGTKTELEVFYEPEDADGGDGIHMRDDPSEPYSNRRIRLEAKVTYDPKNEERLVKAVAALTTNPALVHGYRSYRQGQQGAAGAALDSLNPYSLPTPGPQKDIMVVWTWSESLWDYAEPRAAEWKHIFYNYTDANGIATAYLYPKRDQDLGGVREAVEVNVRANAIVTGIPGPFSIPEAAAAVVEDIADTMQSEGFATIRIERHIPTRWTGSMTIKRTVIGSWSEKSDDRPAKDDPAAVCASVVGGNRWTYEARMDNITLDVDGVGTGTFECRVQSSYDRTVQVVGWGVRGESPALCTTTTKSECQGMGMGRGECAVMLHVDPAAGTYAVYTPDSLVDKAINMQNYRARGSQRSSDDCGGGGHADEIDWRIAPSFGENREATALLLQAPMPIAERGSWKPFDHDATSLSNSITWTKSFRRGGIKFMMSTTVTWNLQRIYD